MKKVLSLIMAALLVLCSVAVAEELPSKTTEDIASVVATVADNGEGASVVIAETDDKTTEIITGVIETILGGAKVESIFTEGTQALLAEKFADAELQINEIWPLAVSGYEEAMGALKATFVFPTVYTAEQTLAAVVTLYTGEAVEEIVLDAVALEDGSVEVTFTADVIAKILAADNALIAVINNK